MTARFEVFFDGECPLCVREIRLLRWLDRRGRVRFTDIAAESFDPAAVGRTFDDLMARIQGRDLEADGTPGPWVEGVEVFRRLYAAVGFSPLVALTRLPGVRHLLDAGYRWFARNRLRLTGRCTADSCALPAPGGRPAAERASRA
jgi:predicted DCC family thiol-disulfide oxidoreductase YuxK